MKDSDVFRRTALSTAVSVALAAGAAGVQAQTTAGPDEVDNVVEEVVVTGFRRSLRDSLSLKEDSQSIVEAVSAEEIGKLPDVSIAESLARLPGLTAQRLNGRGQVISVRGLAPDFTTALLNGRPQVSAGDNRGVEFDQYPAELLSSVVVYKTPDASLIGQGLAGTADMRTVRPLQYGERAFAGNARYEWNSIDALNAGAADEGIRFTASYIDQLMDDTVGISLGIAHMTNPSQGERFNAWGYPEATDDGTLVIGGSKPYVQSNELERTGLIGTIEFQPSDTYSTAVDLYYSEFEETQFLRGIELPLFWSAAELQDGFTASDGLVTEGVYTDVKGVVRNDVNRRAAELFAAGWNHEWILNDKWSAQVDLSYSGIERKDIILETYAGTGPSGEGATDTLGFAVDGTGAFFTPTLDYADPNTILLTSPQGWGGNIVDGGQLGYNNQPNIEDELDLITLSAERAIESGWISQIEFGINYTSRVKSLVNDEWFLALANGEQSAPIPTTTGITNLDYLGIPGMVSYDPIALVNAGTYALIRNPDASVAVKSWEVQEDVSLAFVKFGVDTNWWKVPVRGNFGVQVVHTDQTSSALGASGTGDSVTTVELNGGKDYVEILPSANFNLELSDDSYLRLSLARTLARPRMDELRASQNFGFDASQVDSTDINNSPWSANGGNPELDPWIANALDISYERYFADRTGYFALALFYKDLESYIFDETVVLDFSEFPTGDLEPALNVGLATTPQNGTGGDIYGIELALSVTGEMITPALTGWGAIFNASFTDSEIQPDPNNPATPLPGLSEEVINLTLYYEREGFAARVSNRYRSDFLGEVAGFGNGRNLRMVEAESIIDAQIGYSFQSGPLEGITLLLQGNNLTDEPFTTFQDGDSRQIIDYQRYGRNFLLGASFKY